MKKIYFLQKHLTKLGNVIEYRGFRATVTEELIELNPELFRVEKNIQPMYFKCVKGEGEYNKGRIYKQVNSTGYPEVINPISERGYDLIVYNWQSSYINESRKCFELTTKAEWDMQELLDKAKRDYPAGTMFNSEYGVQKVLSGEPFVGIVMPGTIQINTDRFTGGATIYTPENGWSEIVLPKFTTEDGVDIYGDMKTYLVHPKDIVNIDYCHGLWGGNSTIKYDKYFYHKENALAYIEKHKEKTLEDYEQMLFKKDNSMTFSPNSAYFSVYGWLKDNEPKLYYTKLLQLIADDLNDGWEPDFTNYDEKWYITKKTIDYFYGTIVQGVVYFKLSYLAEKARALLGDKLKYLFN